MRPPIGRALVVSVLLSGAVAAQQAGPVTLVFDNGLDGENLSGTLQGYDGTRFTLDTSIGTVVIPSDGVSCVGEACPAGTAPQVASDEVLLTSLDGRSTVKGALIAIDAGSYVLATDAGEMRVPSEAVTCEGDRCIQAAAIQPVAEIEPAAAFGGPATLHGRGMSIEGTLLDIEDGNYVLEVVGFGALRVSTETYVCEGPGCP